MDLVPVEKKKECWSNEIIWMTSRLNFGISKQSRYLMVYTDKLTLTGTLNFNQYQMQAVSSRVMGRVERLY